MLLFVSWNQLLRWHHSWRLLINLNYYKSNNDSHLCTYLDEFCALFDHYLYLATQIKPLVTHIHDHTLLIYDVELSLTNDIMYYITSFNFSLLTLLISLSPHLCNLLGQWCSLSLSLFPIKYLFLVSHIKFPFGNDSILGNYFWLKMVFSNSIRENNLWIKERAW